MTDGNYLFGYDIHNNRQRRKALKVLRRECLGYQDSVFELKLRPQDAEALAMALLPCIDPEEDRLFYARQSVLTASWQLGCGIMAPAGHLLVVQ